jgi:cystathionine gamma-synthase/methionine-gamma-lyase
LEKKMNLQTKAVHAGDRRTDPSKPGAFVPVTTPIYAASSFFYESTAQLDRVLGREEPGYCYARYDNPTSNALEELMTELEGGTGSVACASGMLAMQTAVMSALVDRRKSVVAANALYGATTSLLSRVLEPFGVDVHFVDICDLETVKARIASVKPGAVILETISNPILRVGAIDRIADACRDNGAALIVDNTFATPLLVRPLSLGAHIVVHSATKFLAGHGDVIAGIIIADADHAEAARALSRTVGPGLGPFESYLTMRGIKTFPLRMERQCANACRVASYLATHPRVQKVHYLADPQHPDADTIKRLLPDGLYGALVTFQLKDASKDHVFRFMDSLRVIVRVPSLGDVHSTVLYPAIASHRDLSPKERERVGITNGTVRLCIGIEAAEDLIGDLDQALSL